MDTADRFLTKQEEGIKTIRFAFQNELHLPTATAGWVWTGARRKQREILRMRFAAS